MNSTMDFSVNTDFSALGFRALPDNSRGIISVSGKNGTWVVYDHNNKKEVTIQDFQGNPLRCITCRLEFISYYVGFYNNKPVLKLRIAIKGEEAKGFYYIQTAFSTVWMRGALLAIESLGQNIKEPLIIGARLVEKEDGSVGNALCAMFDINEVPILPNWDPGRDIFELANTVNQLLTGESMAPPNPEKITAAELSSIQISQRQSEHKAKQDYLERQARKQQYGGAPRHSNGGAITVSPKKGDWILEHPMREVLIEMNNLLHRLGWTAQRCREETAKRFDGITSRQNLSDDQIMEMYEWLSTLSPVEIEEGVF
ncbi:hypothetical protein [Moorena sp. SIO3A2]|uniref:hypothetical protein n=1 Tax=Moorena sp. SIO3A2 TaxID=2607841 RepID=UPI0013B6A40E|nr:hypothetical protein [Moorena sp. SIO3A2]NER90347.1 hypothetical protein [Moorena sp. SIO3A2]